MSRLTIIYRVIMRGQQQLMWSLMVKLNRGMRVTINHMVSRWFKIQGHELEPNQLNIAIDLVNFFLIKTCNFDLLSD